MCVCVCVQGLAYNHGLDRVVITLQHSSVRSVPQQHGVQTL